MKKQLIQKMKAGKVCIVANGKEAQAEVIKLAGAEGMQIEIAQEVFEEQNEGVVYFQAIKTMVGRLMPLQMMLAASVMPDCLVTSDEFKTQEEAFKAACEEELEVVSWVFETEEKPKVSGCSNENALTGFMPSPKQVEKWIKRAEKRGFVKGAQFLGVHGTDADKILTIGEDGIQADDMGTYYKNSRIMYIKDKETVVWAEPLKQEVCDLGAIENKDSIGVQFKDGEKFGAFHLGKTSKGVGKFALVALRNHEVVSEYLTNMRGIKCDEREKLSCPSIRMLIEQLKRGEGQFSTYKFKDKESMVKWLLID